MESVSSPSIQLDQFSSTHWDGILVSRFELCRSMFSNRFDTVFSALFQLTRSVLAERLNVYSSRSFQFESSDLFQSSEQSTLLYLLSIRIDETSTGDPTLHRLHFVEQSRSNFFHRRHIEFVSFFESSQLILLNR